MSYLQVVGEQHQLVERHMAAFTTRLAELQERHGLQLGSLEVSISAFPAFFPFNTSSLQVAADSSNVSASGCGTTFGYVITTSW
jgi:hypothetical protein